MSAFPLGRRTPKNFDHIENFPMGFALPQTVQVVEEVLALPIWHNEHDQGVEGACVGHGWQMSMAIMNTIQALKQGVKAPYVRYDPFWLWNEAKKIDPWSETNPGDNNGTLVSSAGDILRTIGNVPWPDGGEEEARNWQRDISKEILKDAGISTVRWATSVDEIRSSIGVNWYSSFDSPTQVDSSEGSQFWIAQPGEDWGYVRGGHSFSFFGASDKYQCFLGKNNWGIRYPIIRIPYTATDRLIRENGEFALVTDI
jgi:hypothetical protein